VLGLLKAPVMSPAPRIADTVDRKEQQATAVEEKPTVPAAAAPWPPAPSQTQSTDMESPAALNSAATSTQPVSATAVAVAEPPEERRPVTKQAREGNRTKSTFDVLIAALKQNRAVARD
jgi:hypothetical protein